jgi:hypothetical protein
MRKHSRIVGLILLLFGLMPLFSSLSKLRVEAWHGADILAFIALGMCFGVALVGLLGRLRIRNE